MSGSERPEDYLKLTRRHFLHHAAFTASTAAVMGIAAKTDALAQSGGPVVPQSGAADDGHPYPYTN